MIHIEGRKQKGVVVKQLATYVAVSLCLLLAAGCPSKPKGKILGSVNGEALTKEELDGLVPEGFTVDEQNLPGILDKWVSNALLYQEALKRGLDKEPDVKRALDRLRRDYLVNEVLQKLTAASSVSQAELMQYYNAHKDEFTFEVKMQRIVLPDSELAARTLAEVRAGADFTKLAKERSQDMLLEGGQESKYFSRGVGDPRQGGDPSLEEAIFALSPGQVSDAIATQEGYQIIKLVDKKKVKESVTLPEVKEYIQAVLTYRKNQDAVNKLLSSLREKAKVELKPDAYFEQ
jgi:peptidyl-prolyl cis-trans isomerase C